MRATAILILLLTLNQIIYSQTDCTVYTDTMYIVTVVESENVLSHGNRAMEPNFGSFWMKNLKNITPDTSSYLGFMDVFFSNGIIVNNLLHDIEQSYWSICAPDSSKSYRNTMFNDFLKKDYKLKQHRNRKHTHFDISKTRFFSYEFADTIVANVSISVYVSKVVIDYYVVPYERIESTTDFQYNYSMYHYSYRYRLKQIKKVLRIKDKELPNWFDR